MHCGHLTFRRIAFVLFPGLLAGLWGTPTVARQDAHAEHHAMHRMDGSEDSAVSRSIVTVRLPAVQVRQHSGKLVEFAAVVEVDRPVLLNFVYTSCAVICLPMTQIFATAQERLGPRAGQLQMLSVSIDPGQDTPAALSEYAERFHAGSQWTFNTGSQQAIDAIQRAFNVYRPDKMSHTPVTFIRPRGSRQWVRLDGFASPDQLIREALSPVVAAR
jgi:protein SCO1/2